VLAFMPALSIAESIPPTDIATGAAEPSETSARVLGYFNYGATNPPGIAEQCWFEYGSTLAYGNRTNAICSGTTRATLAPLVPGTTYHYRAAASNSAGTTYGPDKSFATLGSPPGGGPPPPGDTPRTTLEIFSAQSLGSVLRGGLRLRLGLVGPCPCVARGKLLVTRDTARRLHIKRSASIAQGRREYRTPGAVKLTLKLKPPVKRMLRRARVLKAIVKVTVTGASGQATVLSRSLRLKRR
jgi:hypothetical protein